MNPTCLRGMFVCNHSIFGKFTNQVRREQAVKFMFNFIVLRSNQVCGRVGKCNHGIPTPHIACFMCALLGGSSKLFLAWVFFLVCCDAVLQSLQGWWGDEAYARVQVYSTPVLLQALVTTFQVTSITETFLRNAPASTVMLNIFETEEYQMLFESGFTHNHQMQEEYIRKAFECVVDHLNPSLTVQRRRRMCIYVCNA